MNLNQPKGTKHTPTHRATLSGRKVPLERPYAPSWHEIFAAAPQAPLRWFEKGHPSRKHDVDLPDPVFLDAPEPVTSGLRRRARRALGRAV